MTPLTLSDVCEAYDPIAVALAARDRAMDEFAAYLRGPFVDDFTRAASLHALASHAERQATAQAALEAAEEAEQLEDA